MERVFLLQMQAMRPKIQATCHSQVHSFQKQMVLWATSCVAVVAVVGQMAAWSAAQMCQMVAVLMGLLLLCEIVKQLQMMTIFQDIMVDLQYRLKFNLSCRGGNIIKLMFEVWQKLVYMEMRIQQMVAQKEDVQRMISQIVSDTSADVSSRAYSLEMEP